MLSIIIPYNLFSTICLEFSQPSLIISCSFVITRVSVLLSFWMTSWSWFTLSGQVRGLTHFCVLYWFTLDYILNLIFTFDFFFWGYVCQYLCPPHKLADIQQFALSLLRTQPVYSPLGHVLLGKANFCAYGHSQLHRLCNVIQIDILTVYHSHTHLLSPVHFSFSGLEKERDLFTSKNQD